MLRFRVLEDLDHLVEMLASFTVVRVTLLVKMTTYIFCRRVVRM